MPWCSGGPPLTLREELELGPIDRCTKRGRWPVILALHVAMVFIATAQFVDFCGEANGHTLGMHDALTDAILPVEFRKQSTTPNDRLETASYEIYSIDSWLDNWRYAVNSVFDLESQSLFERVEDLRGVQWHVERWDLKDVAQGDFAMPVAIKRRVVTPLRNASTWWPRGLKPNDVAQRTAYVRELRTAELSFSFQTWYVERSGFAAFLGSLSLFTDDTQPTVQHSCARWNASVFYDLRLSARIRAVLTTAIVAPCGDVDAQLQPISTLRFALAIVVIIGSALQLCVGMWFAGRVASLYCAQRARAAQWARTAGDPAARAVARCGLPASCPHCGCGGRRGGGARLSTATPLLAGASRTSLPDAGAAAKRAAAQLAEERARAARDAFVGAIRGLERSAERRAAMSFDALALALGDNVTAAMAEDELLRQR